MYKNESVYQALIMDVLQNGVARPDRTGTGTSEPFAQNSKPFEASGGALD